MLYSLGGAESPPSTPHQSKSLRRRSCVPSKSAQDPNLRVPKPILTSSPMTSRLSLNSPQASQNDWLPASASGALAPIPRRSVTRSDPDIVTTADIPAALQSIPSLCLTLPAGQMWTRRMVCTPMPSSVVAPGSVRSRWRSSIRKLPVHPQQLWPAHPRRPRPCRGDVEKVFPALFPW